MKRLRFAVEREREGLLLRWWWDHVERAWLALEICGLRLNVESPSDWHEDRLLWLHFGAGFFRGGISWKWYGRIVPDNGQCSGPRYGFQFFEDRGSFRRDDMKTKVSDPDACFLCGVYIPVEWASYVEVIRGEIRRAHLECGDEANHEAMITMYFNA